MTLPNLDTIRDRAERAYQGVLDHYADDDAVPTVVREHFNYDVPALIGAIKRLTEAGGAYQLGVDHGRTQVATKIAEELRAHRIIRREVRPWE